MKPSIPMPHPLALILLGLLLATASCSSGPDTRLFRVGLLSAPDTLDPARIKDDTGILLASQIFEGLVSVNPQSGAVEPALAESWTCSPDGLEYRFVLAKTVWSDGRILSAADVRESWLRMLDPALKAPFGWFPAVYLQGGRAYYAAKPESTEPAKLKELRDAVAITVLDDHTLSVRLVRSDSRFLWALGHFSFWVLPAPSLADWTASGITPKNFCGCGPFLLSDSTDGTLILKSNALYRKSGSVHLKEVRFSTFADFPGLQKAWANGTIDHVPQVPAEFRKEYLKDPALQNVPGFATYYFVFNTRNAALRNPAVRQALCMAVDTRDLVANLINRGMVPLGGIVPAMPGLEGLPPAPVDPEGAIKLLGAAGYDGTKKVLSLDLVYNKNESNLLVAEYLSVAWKKIGVETKVEGLELSDYLERQESASFDVLRSGWQDLHLDPLGFLERFASDSSQNDAGYANPAFDALVHKIRALPWDQSIPNLPLVREAEQLLVGDHVVLPILQYAQQSLLRQGVWTGWYPNAINRHDYARIQEIK